MFASRIRRTTAEHGFAGVSELFFVVVYTQVYGAEIISERIEDSPVL